MFSILLVSGVRLAELWSADICHAYPSGLPLKLSHMVEVEDCTNAVFKCSGDDKSSLFKGAAD